MTIRYWIQQKEELMEVTNKMNTIILLHGKAVKTISFESEIFDYVLNNRALGNDVTCNEVIIKKEVWMKI